MSSFESQNGPFEFAEEEIQLQKGRTLENMQAWAQYGGDVLHSFELERSWIIGGRYELELSATREINPDDGSEHYSDCTISITDEDDDTIFEINFDLDELEQTGITVEPEFALSYLDFAFQLTDESGVLDGQTSNFSSQLNSIAHRVIESDEENPELPYAQLFELYSESLSLLSSKFTGVNLEMKREVTMEVEDGQFEQLSIGEGYRQSFDEELGYPEDIEGAYLFAEWWLENADEYIRIAFDQDGEEVAIDGLLDDDDIEYYSYMLADQDEEHIQLDVYHFINSKIRQFSQE